jgi:AraC family transcriptional regulator
MPYAAHAIPAKVSLPVFLPDFHERRAVRASLAARETWRDPAMRFDGDGAQTVQKHWKGLSVMINDLRPCGAVDLVSTAGFDRMVAILREVGGRFCADVAGEPSRAGRDRSPSLFYVPAGVRLRLAAPTMREARILTVQFDARRIMRGVGNDHSIRGPGAGRAIHDRRLTALAQMFEAECLAPEGADPIFGDCLAMSLISILADRGPAPAKSGVKGLTDRQLSLVTDYIDKNLSEPIAGADLANLVGLSPGHFCRAFKAVTGHPPHTWFTARRIDRAKSLMAGPLSLVQVALGTGFSDQPHFTRAFTRFEGVSPGAWRRQQDAQRPLAMAS